MTGTALDRYRKSLEQSASVFEQALQAEADPEIAAVVRDLAACCQRLHVLDLDPAELDRQERKMARLRAETITQPLRIGVDG